MKWFRGAACADLSLEESERMFFGPDWSERQEGIRLCHRCPLSAQCLEIAMTREKAVGPQGAAGTWGGLTPAQRNHLRREAVS